MSKKTNTKKNNKSKLRKVPKLFGVGKEKEYIAERLSTLVRGGVSVVDAVTAIAEDIKSKPMKKVLGFMIEDINNGLAVWKAFEASKLFKDHTIALIRIGEETGRLSENLQVVATEGAKTREFNSKVRSAMMYPVFVLGLTAVIGIGIAWFILPKLSLVFSQLNLELPLITRVLIDIGGLLQDYGQIIIPAFVFGVLFFLFILFFNKSTKFIGQWILFHTPGVKGLIKEIEIARFGFLFGTLLNVGLPISQAIGSLENITESRTYKKLYVHMNKSITEGDSFKKTFAKYENISSLIPLSTRQMVISAEQSGNLAGVLLQIGENSEKKTENMTKNLTVILEPILLVAVWLGVVGVALGVIMPIYSLVGGLNDPSAKSFNNVPPVVETAPSSSENLSLEDVLSLSEEAKVEVLELKILTTGFGYLNVREFADLSSSKIGKVLSDEVYEYSEVSADGKWYEITLTTGEMGWVFWGYIQELNESGNGE
jgi:type II secretory pathway component PulF